MHKETCPWCGNEGCEADWVDIGVGMQQCGPFGCEKCGAHESGPPDDLSVNDFRRLEAEGRMKGGWWKGDAPVDA